MALNIPDALPVPQHGTFHVLDSTKIKTFMDCPRKFFYEYVCGIRKDEPNEHLVFGSAWHDAIEHIMNNGRNRESVLDAANIFMETYKKGYEGKEHFLPGASNAKTPENGLNLLVAYLNEYKSDEYETLFTEVAGAVPISQDRQLHVKFDSVIRRRDGIWSLEHKTTGRLTQAWKDKWQIDFQVGAYNHALRCLFPNEQVRGIIVNGAVVRDKSYEFLRIPVSRDGKQALMFLWEANHWVDMIEWNFNELAQSKIDDPIMMAFPKNVESCGKFGCKYPEFCWIKPNPIYLAHENVPGHKREFWDPRTRLDDAKAVIVDGERIIKNKKEEQTT